MKFPKPKLFLKNDQIKIMRQIYNKMSTCGSHDDEDLRTPTKIEEPIRLEEKNAIINGGASGIGLGIAREFLKRGMPCLTITDIDAEKGEYIQEKLNKEFGANTVQFFEADVSNAKELDDVYRKAIFYNDIPEIVVNSAGVMNDTKWEVQLQTNLAGCAISTLISMQYMAKSSKGFGGTIVNMASVFGITPLCGYPLHSMTQFGVCGFSKALGSGSHYDRTNVKIFALCTGLTDTNLLADAPKHAINENFAKEYLEEIKGAKVQKVENVAKGLVEILSVAKKGSIWVVENDQKPYEVSYPGIVRDVRKDDLELQMQVRW